MSVVWNVLLLEKKYQSSSAASWASGYTVWCRKKSCLQPTFRKERERERKYFCGVGSGDSVDLRWLKKACLRGTSVWLRHDPALSFTTANVYDIEEAKQAASLFFFLNSGAILRMYFHLIMYCTLKTDSFLCRNCCMASGNIWKRILIITPQCWHPPTQTEMK